MPRRRRDAEKNTLSKVERLVRAGVGAAILGYLTAARFHDPLPVEPSLCVFKSVAGLPCPSYGLTHSLHEFFRGHWAESFHVFPPVPIYLAGFLAILTILTLEIVFRRALIPSKVIQRGAWAILILVLGTWLARGAVSFFLN